MLVFEKDHEGEGSGIPVFSMDRVTVQSTDLVSAVELVSKLFEGVTKFWIPARLRDTSCVLVVVCWRLCLVPHVRRLVYA